MTAHRVKIAATEKPGVARIEVDGTDIAPVVDGVQLNLRPGHLPVLSLTMCPAAAETELYAYVVGMQIADQQDKVAIGDRIRADLLDELRQVDPEELQEDALSRLGGLGGGVADTGQAFLDAILERLQ